MSAVLFEGIGLVRQRHHGYYQSEHYDPYEAAILARDKKIAQRPAEQG